jgi:C4-type Zn-finger protein
LAAEEADLDLSLVQPASMFGRVMHSKRTCETCGFRLLPPV